MSDKYRNRQQYIKRNYQLYLVLKETERSV